MVPQYVYVVNAVVLANASAPIDITPFGIVIEFSPVPLNALPSIVVRIIGKLIEVSAVADSNVFCRICVIPIGIVMEVKAVFL